MHPPLVAVTSLRSSLGMSDFMQDDLADFLIREQHAVVLGQGDSVGNPRRVSHLAKLGLTQALLGMVKAKLKTTDTVRGHEHPRLLLYLL